VSETLEKAELFAYNAHSFVAAMKRERVSADGERIRRSAGPPPFRVKSREMRSCSGEKNRELLEKRERTNAVTQAIIDRSRLNSRAPSPEDYLKWQSTFEKTQKVLAEHFATPRNAALRRLNANGRRQALDMKAQAALEYLKQNRGGAQSAPRRPLPHALQPVRHRCCCAVLYALPFLTVLYSAVIQTEEFRASFRATFRSVPDTVANWRGFVGAGDWSQAPGEHLRGSPPTLQTAKLLQNFTRNGICVFRVPEPYEQTAVFAFSVHFFQSVAVWR
jgi:hypothetical protein